jgi:beta-alanine degradation protein BauB
MDKAVIEKWPDAPPQLSPDLRAEFTANLGNGRVGSRLVSETDRVRVWHLQLAPGERIGFHTHVLDYFWTVLTAGRARSHYSNGETNDVQYQPGDTKHHTYGPDEFMIHDLENTGDRALIFTTVEFKESANQPTATESHRECRGKRCLNPPGTSDTGTTICAGDDDGCGPIRPCAR